MSDNGNDELNYDDYVQKSAIERDLIDLENSPSPLDKSFTELFNAENLFKKTDLTRNEIADITRILVIAQGWGICWLEKSVNTFLELMVSKKRKGRTEMVDIAQAELVREKQVAQAYANMEKTKKRG